MYEADMNWDQRVAADAAVSERVAFIQKTYLHVGGAIVAYAIILAALVNFAPVEWMARLFSGQSGFLILFLGFMAVSYAAQYMAQGHFSKSTQYLGLLLYTAMVALVSWPAVYVCSTFPGYSGILSQAIILTLAIAGGLTMSVFVTKADLSWMGRGLCILGWILPAVCLAGILFNFTLGLGIMCLFGLVICGFIMYETSMVLHHFRTTEYVGAALALFASIATLFRIVLSILMSSRD